MKIGIFDSGIGGLGIYQEITKIIPNISTIYIADTASCPYGEKSVSEIKALCQKNAQFLLQHKVEIVVVACNSASVSALIWLRNKFPNTPIVGVVPVIKKAALISKKIGILATRRTIESHYLRNLVNQFCPKSLGYKTLYQPCSELVDYIENFDKKQNLRLSQVLKVCTERLIKQQVDVIALGCTHFPFVKKEIQKIVGKNVIILDSNGAVAKQVKKIADSCNNANSQKSVHQFFTTGDVGKVTKVAQVLLKNKQIRFKSIKY
ncbi:MAG: glutamate racemase [Candidatus Berkelbacteria bacterium]|nr:glutamate racemase [Candidatus Berkelbacteria bacterium]